ncbi:MAG: M48 family metallopeptidase [Saprospiraceae bacterium]|nr:M48 family metallopeptidase [Saprospiraceae bacterium]
MHSITIGEIAVEVIRKNIKNVHLSVHPPAGRVRIAAPMRMDMDTIRVFAIAKLNWIRKQQQKLLSQNREAPREYLPRESHYFLGNTYLLKITPTKRNAPAKIELNFDTIELHIRENADAKAKERLLNEWYRKQLKAILPELIAKWEKQMGVKVESFGIKKMKTRWGTCNIPEKRIWLNLELAKKPVECIEYIVVHEMTHLLERTHNPVFTGYMNKFLPQWRLLKEELNRLPVGYEG